MGSRLSITDNVTQGRLELVEREGGWGLGWVFYALALCTLTCGGVSVLGLSEGDWNNACLTGVTALGVGGLTYIAAQSYRDVTSEPRLYVALTPGGIEYESLTALFRYPRHQFQFLLVERTQEPCLKLWLGLNPRGPVPGADSGWVLLVSHSVDRWSDREEQHLHLLREAILRMGLHECPPGFVAPPEEPPPPARKKPRRRKKRRPWG